MPLAQAQIDPRPTLGIAPPIDTGDAWFSAGDIMNAILVLAVIGIAISFWRAHRDKSNNFNVLDLIMEPGRDGVKRLSLLKCMCMTGFAVYTWAIVRWIITGSVTTSDMREYAIACIAPVVAAIIANSRKDAANAERSDEQKN